MKGGYHIAVGGLHHETNSFAPGAAAYADFVAPDAWPGLSFGTDLLHVFGDLNLPLPGFMEAASGHNLRPVLWGAAPPSGPVTAEAYAALTGQLIDGIAAAGPLDAIYLDLHGAMIADGVPDGEGDLLRRLRDRVGDVPIAVTLDFHANITQEIFDKSDIICVYRTYPHVDMRASGARTFAALSALLARGQKPHKARRVGDYLIPISQQCTLAEPAASLFKGLQRYDHAPAAENISADGILTVSLAAGFPPADMADSGPVALAYGWDAQAVDGAVDSIAADLAAAESQFSNGVLPLDRAVTKAQQLASTASRPVILADTQDNPGAGGAGNTVGLLRALLAAGVQNSAFGVLADAAAAAAAHRAGIGQIISCSLGTQEHGPDWGPVSGQWRVDALSDGCFAATGPFFKGSQFDLGPMAVLRSVAAAEQGVQIIVSTQKQQLADQAMMTHLGLDPAAFDIIALKSSVHFRADFQDMAGAVIVVAAPGPNIDNPAYLPYRHLRASVRRAPGLI